jgi:hypothetical protein
MIFAEISLSMKEKTGGGQAKNLGIFWSSLPVAGKENRGWASGVEGLTSFFISGKS